MIGVEIEPEDREARVAMDTWAVRALLVFFAFLLLVVSLYLGQSIAKSNYGAFMEHLGRQTALHAVEHRGLEGEYPSDPEAITLTSGMAEASLDVQVTHASGGDDYFLAILRGEEGFPYPDHECVIGHGAVPGDVDTAWAGKVLAGVTCHVDSMLSFRSASPERSIPDPTEARDLIAASDKRR